MRESILVVAALLTTAHPLMGQVVTTPGSVRIVIPEGMPAFAPDVTERHPEAMGLRALVMPWDLGGDESSVILLNPEHANAETLDEALRLLVHVFDRASRRPAEPDTTSEPSRFRQPPSVGGAPRVLVVPVGRSLPRGSGVEPTTLQGLLTDLDRSSTEQILKLGKGRMITLAFPEGPVREGGR